MKCLEKDRNRRYDSANRLAADIERFLNDEPVHACPPSAVYRFHKFARRNQIALAAGTVVAIAVCITALVASLSAISLREQQQTTIQHLRKAQHAERNAKRRLVDARLAQAHSGRNSQEPGHRLAGWQAIGEAATLARELQADEKLVRELRNEATACLTQPDVRLESQWDGWPKGSLGLAFDADLKRYAYSDEQGNITIRSAPDGRELARLSGEGPNTAAPHLRFSPDGRYLLARHHQQTDQRSNFRLWDWRNGKILLQPVEQLDYFVVDFSSDGQHLVVGTPRRVDFLRSRIAQRNAASRRRHRAGSAGLSPEGRKIRRDQRAQWKSAIDRPA
jgi:hypothetical protein